MNWKRPVPLWAFLIGIVATASATAGVLFLPSVLNPKPDFAMSGLNPMYVQAAGSSGAASITISATRNFTGIVTVTTSSPIGVTAKLQDSIGNAKDQVLLGKAGNITLTVACQKAGNYTVTVTAFSGAISHTQSLPVIAQDLTMSATPSPLTITRGSSGTVELDLASVNGLSGNVSFAITVYGSSSSYVDTASSVSANPPSIVLSPSGKGKIALTINVGRSDNSTSLDVIVYATMKQSWEFRIDIQVTIV